MSEIRLPYPKTVSKYNSLYNDENSYDITFLFENSTYVIKAHKIILEAVSPTFKVMFSGTFTEKNTATIHDIRPEIFERLIKTIYLFPVTIYNVLEAVELYNAAEMYQMEDLKDISKNYMLAYCYWDNCLFLYDKASLFELRDILERCEMFFKRYDYQIFVSHLFKDGEISEEAFIAAGTHWKGEPGELHQLLETYVEMGKLKSYKKVISTIHVLSLSTDEVIAAKLLTSGEKCAIIANIEAHDRDHETFIPLPEHLSPDRYANCKSEARRLAQLIWIAILLACPNKEYTQLVLRKCLCFSAAFLSGTELTACKQAFDRQTRGERIRKIDFELLVQVMRNRSYIMERYEVIYEGSTKVRVVEQSIADDDNDKHELFSYAFKDDSDDEY